MNNYEDDYESRREARRAEEHRYQMDVMYEVWRSGGNTDRIDRERVSDAFSNGDDESLAARREIAKMRPKPPQEEAQQARQRLAIPSRCARLKRKVLRPD